MYPFDAPFWQKLFFITMVAGVYLFIDMVGWLLPSMKRNWRDFIRNAKENYRNDIEKTKEILNMKKITSMIIVMLFSITTFLIFSLIAFIIASILLPLAILTFWL